MYFQNFKVFLDFKVFLEFTRIKRNTRGHTLESISSLVLKRFCRSMLLQKRSEVKTRKREAVENDVTNSCSVVIVQPKVESEFM